MRYQRNCCRSTGRARVHIYPPSYTCVRFLIVIAGDIFSCSVNLGNMSDSWDFAFEFETLVVGNSNLR
jgi:hypothetical protein